MQVQLNLTFDLDTAAGRKTFAQLQNALLPLDQQVNLVPKEPESEVRARVNLSSVPDDPDRAAAALAGRQAAAAKARAAKAAKAGSAPVGPDTLIEDPIGPRTNGQDQAVEDELGLVDPNMSPAEAKEAGLALVREAYAAGKVAQVKALQKSWQIAKFYDIPNERGHEFFAAVMKLAHETGLRK